MGAGQDVRREVHKSRGDRLPSLRVIEDLERSLALKDTTRVWSRAAVSILVFSVACGLVLRLIGLSAEGFADDEVHKWLAANRYLHFGIVGIRAYDSTLTKRHVSL